MGKDWSLSGLLPALQTAVTTDFGFLTMTPVQAAAIPLFSQNKDVCVEACTGSGKTLTYLLPIFHKLIQRSEENSVLFAMVIAPSRELAHQIYEVAVRVNNAAGCGFGVYCMTGGTSIPQEMAVLESSPPQILIATPGRLCDMLEKVPDWDIHSLEILVLDEADRLLDMGFKEKIRTIVRALPKQRRTGLFSATMSTEVKELISAGLRNPAFIAVKTKSKVTDVKTQGDMSVLPKGLTNYFLTVSDSVQKVNCLISFLSSSLSSKTIVFFSTCDSTNFFHMVLSHLPAFSAYPLLRIHGKMPQRKREKVYSRFESAGNGILLTTDLIARGIDFPNIDWIVQFDPPKSPDAFVHRIGRTARAGKVGKTLVVLREHEQAYVPFLQKRGVPLEEFTQSSSDFSSSIASTVLSDREIYEQAQAAFVSYLRYYQEQELAFIFRMRELDLGALAHSFCLLRLPRVTEILGKSIPTFTQSDIDPETIAYKDPVKEQRRTEEKERKQEELEARRSLSHACSTEKKARSRSEKREARRGTLAKELDSLQREENIVRKIKKGKVNSQEVREFLEQHPNINAIFRRKKH